MDTRALCTDRTHFAPHLIRAQPTSPLQAQPKVAKFHQRMGEMAQPSEVRRLDAAFCVKSITDPSPRVFA